MKTRTMPTGGPVRQMQQERETLIQEGKQLFAAIGAAHRPMTDAEKRRDDEIQAAITALDQKLEAEAIVQDRERAEIAAGVIGDFPRRRSGPMGRTYAAMFPEEGLSNDGFDSLDEWFRAIHSGLHHPGLRISAALHTGGVPSSGGFVIPTEYAAMILDASLEKEIVRPRCLVVPMQSDSKKIPGWDDADHSAGALFGGFKATWLAEAGAAADVTGKLYLRELVAKKLALFTRVSNELIADGQGFEEALGEALILAAGWNLDDAFLTGDGAGRPQGVLFNPALITVLKETAQSAATIVYENLVKMFARLHPACMANSVWIANPSTIPQLLTLSVAVGTAGSHVPVLAEAGGTYSMLTRPVLFTEKLPALGTKGDLLFCDLSQYVVGLKKGAGRGEKRARRLADGYQRLPRHPARGRPGLVEERADAEERQHAELVGRARDAKLGRPPVRAFDWLPPRIWDCPGCGTALRTREAAPRCGRCGFREGT